jgi:integrase
MQADELDLRRAIWSIPAGKAKKGRPMTVHLPHPAMEILAGRLERVEGNYLFPPNRGGGKSPHWIDPIPRWRRLCKAAGLAGLRLHDLRRTLGSWAAAGGSSLLVIGKALGHIDPKTTETYARLNIDPIRVAVDGAVNAMLAVGRPPVALPALSPAD